MRRPLHSIKFKIIAATLACVAAVTLASTFVLYNYLNHLLQQQNARIQQMHLSTLQAQMDKYLDDFLSLVLVCANDNTISSAAGLGGVNNLTLNAQNRLNTSLKACPGEGYVDKFFTFNTLGGIIQTNTRQYGSLQDGARVMESALYQNALADDFKAPYTIALAPSVHRDERTAQYGPQTVVAVLCPMQRGRQVPTSFVYLEVGLDLFTDLLAPYAEANDVFLAGPDGALLSDVPAALPGDFSLSEVSNGAFTLGGHRWLMLSETLSGGGMTVNSCFQTDALDQDGVQVLYVVIVVFLTGLAVAAVLAVIVSAFLTRPIRRLDERLRRITANDFSFDPEIERSKDEIGAMGHTVNEMALSIDHLLHETQEMYEQRKNIEISLLQSQVNPHFLYNTLDTIRWMAVIQKCPGIAGMVGSLVNLLKNVAKGTQDKITLREELSLLDDYIAIQSVRYMETFTFENRVPEELLSCRIVKLTLQPLVENAIFHGIEPTGECGIITLRGRLDGGDVELCVEDDGAGIEPEKLAGLLTAPHKRDRSSLNGIGVANVHQRLQLIYGKRYGLRVESELGKFTRVFVRFPKEE